MPGIRIDFPVGEDWDYSLNMTDWQTSPTFYTQPDGSAFAPDGVYTVYCRNQSVPVVCQQDVVFGQSTTQPTLMYLVKLASDEVKVAFLTALLKALPLDLQQVLANGAQATIMPIFEGGLSALLPDLPPNMAYAQVVVGEDQQFYQTELSHPLLPTFTFGTQKIERAIVSPVDIAFTGPTTIREGTTIQKDAYLVYSDGSQSKITGTGQRQSSAIDLQWDESGNLFAQANLTEGDTRTATLTITSGGITKAQPITIVDASSIVPNGNLRLTDGSLIEGGAPVPFKLQRQLTDNSWEDYPDAYTLRFQNPFAGLTVDADGYAQCAANSINQNQTRTLEAVIAGSQNYNVTLQSETAAGTGLSYTEDGTKEGILTYSYTGCPATGNYPAVLRCRSTNSAPIARISINGGASFDVQLAKTDGVLRNFDLTLPLIAGAGTIRIEPVGYFAQDYLQINGTGSVDQILATVLVPVQNVDPPPVLNPRITKIEHRYDVVTTGGVTRKWVGIRVTAVDGATGEVDWTSNGDAFDDYYQNCSTITTYPSQSSFYGFYIDTEEATTSIEFKVRQTGTTTVLADETITTGSTNSDWVTDYTAP